MLVFNKLLAFVSLLKENTGSGTEINCSVAVENVNRCTLLRRSVFLNPLFITNSTVSFGAFSSHWNTQFLRPVIWKVSLVIDKQRLLYEKVYAVLGSGAFSKRGKGQDPHNTIGRVFLRLAGDIATMPRGQPNRNRTSIKINWIYRILNLLVLYNGQCVVHSYYPPRLTGALKRSRDAVERLRWAMKDESGYSRDKRAYDTHSYGSMLVTFSGQMDCECSNYNLVLSTDRAAMKVASEIYLLFCSIEQSSAIEK